jgi:hypothetical protein
MGIQSARLVAVRQDVSSSIMIWTTWLLCEGVGRERLKHEEAKATE